jgi:predicted CoA-binding protein
MRTPDDILRDARHVVVMDYPSRDVPDALTRAGFSVTIYGGPTEADVVVSELSDGSVVHRQAGRYPDRADVLYVFRPLSEIDGIIAEARRLGVTTVWRQPADGASADESAEWRRMVESAGLEYVDGTAIDEVAARLTD